MANTNVTENKTTTKSYARHWLVKRGFALILGLFIITSLVSTAAAKIAPINTNDNVWDSNWGNPMHIDTISGPAGFDIDTFWVNTDASSPTTYYFGLSTIGTLDTNAIVYFFIDCNDNNSFTDPVDRILEYDPLNDWVTEYTGDESTTEFGADTDGEKISSGGNDSVEVMTTNAGTVSWSTCQLANHQIKAEIWNDIITNVPDSSPSQSSTPPRVYDLPTAVTLNNVTGSNPMTGKLWLPVCVILAALITLVWALRTKRA